MVKGLGFSDFLDTEFLPDRGVEHLYVVGWLISGAVASDGRLGIFPESRPCLGEGIDGLLPNCATRRR